MCPRLHLPVSWSGMICTLPLSLLLSASCYLLVLLNKKTNFQRALFQVIVQGGRKVRNHREKERDREKRHNKRRVTRSVITPRHVEALVVADASMMQFHEGGDVETYLLTIMNMVSSLYKDPTIGNSIHVVVVKIILLEEEDAYQDLNVTNAAISTLESFCR